MSELREQLRSARNVYQSVRYPGHLAVDLLGRPHRPLPPILLILGTVGAGAIAAATLLLCVARPAASPATVSPAPQIPIVRGINPVPPKLQFELPSLQQLRGLPSIDYLSVVRPLNNLIPSIFRGLFTGSSSSDSGPHAAAEGNPGAESIT